MRTPSLASPSATRDTWVGAVYLAAGLFFANAGRGYEWGTLADIGPGLLPFWLGLFLAAVGVASLLRGLRQRARRSTAAAPAGGHVRRLGALRPLLLVLLSVVAFGWAVRPLGLLPATAIAVFIASRASPMLRWWQAALFALALAAFCCVLFVGVLGLQMEVTPLRADARPPGGAVLADRRSRIRGTLDETRDVSGWRAAPITRGS